MSDRITRPTIFRSTSLHSLWQAAIWQPLRASYGRTTLSIVAIALGVALGFSIDAMNRAASDEMIRAARSLYGQADLSVQGTPQGFDENLYTTIAHVSGVATASPVLQVEARLAGPRNNITLLAMDFLRAASMQTTLLGSGRTTNTRPSAGRDSLSLFDPQSVWLSASAANAIDAHLGDIVNVQVDTHLLSFKVAGVLPAAAYPHHVGLLDIAAAQWRLARLGMLTRIDVRLMPGVDARSVAAAIAQRLPPNVKVSTPADESQQSLQLSRAFTTNLTALALVSLFTGAFLVYSTQSLSVMRRRREFALLHALGVTRREQIVAVIASGVLLGIVGALLGLALGAALATLGLEFLFRSLTVGITPHVSFYAWQGCGFFVLGVLVSAIGSVMPALAAARIPTAQALKAGDSDDDMMAKHGNDRSTVSVLAWGVALWLVVPLLLLLPPVSGLPLPGYAAIALTLLGAVLLIPAFTRRAISWLPAGRNVIYQTALAQLRGTAHKATVSVAAILVSVSLMVAMGIMVTSLRGSFADSLIRMLPADLYVSAGDTQLSYLDADTLQTLTATPGIDRIAVTRSVDILFAKDRPAVTLIARPLAGKDVSTVLWLEREAKQPLPTGALSVWISVAFADDYGVGPDSELQLPLGDRTIRASVRGVWRDNGRQNDALTLDIDRYRQLTGDTRVSSLGIWLQRGVSLENTMNLMRSRMPPGTAVELGIPSELRATRLAGFDRVFAVTYLLEAVAVLIGLFGISASASAQALARRAEFGVLRHLGFTRRQIGRLLAIEGLALGTLGVWAGLCVGSVISMILIYVVGRQSFHWVMDIHVPIAALLAVALVVPVAAALTALWSGRSAMGMDVVRAVKEDW